VSYFNVAIGQIVEDRPTKGKVKFEKRAIKCTRETLTSNCRKANDDEDDEPQQRESDMSRKVKASQEQSRRGWLENRNASGDLWIPRGAEPDSEDGLI
jgi:hypothetical protein